MNWHIGQRYKNHFAFRIGNEEFFSRRSMSWINPGFAAMICVVVTFTPWSRLRLGDGRQCVAGMDFVIVTLLFLASRWNRSII